MNLLVCLVALLSRGFVGERYKTSVLMAVRGPTVQPSRPNSCTYWVTPNLLAGEYPSDARGEDKTREKIRGYLDVGITDFIDLTRPGEKLEYTTILSEEAAVKGVEARHHRIPIQDFGIPLTETMTEILNEIDAAVKESKKVYIHCRGGIGRTGTTVGCYLARHGNTGEGALKEVNRLFRTSDRSLESSRSPETVEQMEFVRSWQENESES